jgi:3-methyladenine DNA glycosylase/8-oxoguanine DNA glycosylase
MASDSKLKPVIDNLRGMRNSCFENLYEAINIGVMLQNATIGRTEQMMGNMLSNYGSIIRYGGKDLFVFYTPRSILDTNEERLRDLKIGYRAKFVMNTAQYFADNEMLEEEVKQISIDEARARLLEIKGVGPYTANMLLFSYLRSPGFINFDVWNRKILSKFLFDNEGVDVETLSKECEKRWGKYQGYAALYIIENLFVNNPELQYWKNKKTE